MPLQKKVQLKKASRYRMTEAERRIDGGGIDVDIQVMSGISDRFLLAKMDVQLEQSIEIVRKG